MGIQNETLTDKETRGQVSTVKWQNQSYWEARVFIKRKKREAHFQYKKICNMASRHSVLHQLPCRWNNKARKCPIMENYDIIYHILVKARGKRKLLNSFQGSWQDRGTSSGHIKLNILLAAIVRHLLIIHCVIRYTTVHLVLSKA